jgi:hypothetical protein
MNYRKLLLAYIAHVKCNEGTDFIGYSAGGVAGGISDEEWQELVALSEIVDRAEAAAHDRVKDMPAGTERAIAYGNALKAGFST